MANDEADDMDEMAVEHTASYGERSFIELQNAERVARGTRNQNAMAVVRVLHHGFAAVTYAIVELTEIADELRRDLRAQRAASDPD